MRLCMHDFITFTVPHSCSLEPHNCSLVSTESVIIMVKTEMQNFLYCWSVRHNITDLHKFTLDPLPPNSPPPSRSLLVVLAGSVVYLN